MNDLLERVKHQDERERLASEAEAVHRILAERDDELLSLLAYSKAPTAIVRKVKKHLADDRESFRYLLRKQTMVERIAVDPSKFAITLFSEAGHALSRERLSEGEKQIFAVSVLWGLARASAHPLPAIIDTPMARLDAAHRQHLSFFSAQERCVALCGEDLLLIG